MFIANADHARPHAGSDEIEAIGTTRCERDRSC
ncbi:MAG: hypothetical protein ACI841_002654, partial [Planctomycetota bacterium]